MIHAAILPKYFKIVLTGWDRHYYKAEYSGSSSFGKIDRSFSAIVGTAAPQ